MMDQNRDPSTRPLRRSDLNKKKKMDRILTVLIVIVTVLIIVNFISLLAKDTEAPSEVVKEDKNKEAQNNSNLKEESTKENNEAKEDSSSSSEESSDLAQSDTQEGQIVVRSSDDPIVSEVIENPHWDVTPTGQTGEHISAYEIGHIDYEEKLQTLKNAVKIDEKNIIYWSVKHNGSHSQSVGVVSTYDQSEMYRVYIEWVEGKGWKPVLVERLRQLEGAY